MISGPTLGRLGRSERSHNVDWLCAAGQKAWSKRQDLFAGMRKLESQETHNKESMSTKKCKNNFNPLSLEKSLKSKSTSLLLQHFIEEVTVWIQWEA